MGKLDSEKLSKVSGGGTIDPAIAASYDEAMDMVRDLDPDFLKRWAELHQDLYEQHKTEIDAALISPLDTDKLCMVAGGAGGTTMANIKNPICGVSFEDAMKHAEELGSDRKDMGGWIRMNNVDYLKWWASCNVSEYTEHKDAIDAIICIKDAAAD